MTNSGTPSAAVLDFTLVPGPPGIPGPQGVQGDPAQLVGMVVTFGPMTCPPGQGSIPKGYSMPAGCTAPIIAISKP